MSVTIAQAIAQIGVGYRAPSVATLGMQNPFGKQDGRSGYWRLFYIQLQEQALKESKVEKAEKPALEPVLEVVEQSDGSALVKSPFRSRKTRVKPLPAEETVTYKPVKIPEPVVGEIPNYLQWLWNITIETRVMLASIQQTRLKFNNPLESQDDDDVELLLLVA